MGTRLEDGYAYTTAEWAALDPFVPKLGQRCLDVTAGREKIGDGLTTYAALAAVPTPGGGGSLPDGGTTGQTLTKASDADGDADWEDPSGGGGDAIPIGDVTGYRIDTTTYDNPITGGPDKIKVNVFPAAPPDGDQVMFGVALEGDAFPRELHFADPTSGGSDFGDGTTDPWNAASAGWAVSKNDDNSYMFRLFGKLGWDVGRLDPNYGGTVGSANNGALKIPGTAENGGATVQMSGGHGVPVCGGYAGDIYVDVDGSDGAWLYRCTTSGVAGDAVWAAKL